jgi:anti-anti-sigma regulatory factor
MAQGKALVLSGEADYVAVPALWDLLHELLTEKLPLLVIDLTAVTFLNTPVWAALQVYQREGFPDSRLAICGMSDAIAAAFDINGVGEEVDQGGRIAIYPTYEDALAQGEGTVSGA